MDPTLKITTLTVGRSMPRQSGMKFTVLLAVKPMVEFLTLSPRSRALAGIQKADVVAQNLRVIKRQR
jgi:hypothetical protein